MVAIEFGMWRSGLIGGASGSVTGGNGKVLEQPGATRSAGGNGLPLGDQKPVSRDAQRGVMMEAPPTSSLKMSKPNFLFELLIVSLNAPTQLCHVYKMRQSDLCRKC